MENTNMDTGEIRKKLAGYIIVSLNHDNPETAKNILDQVQDEMDGSLCYAQAKYHKYRGNTLEMVKSLKNGLGYDEMTTRNILRFLFKTNPSDNPGNHDVIKMMIE